LVIPNTWTWTWTWSAMMFPIILVFQMSDFWYEIKTELKLRYLLSDLKHWLKNPGRFVSTNTNTNWSWFLVDPLDDEDWKRSSTNWSSKRLTMCDLKKMEEYYSLILINRSSLSYFTLAWQSNFLQIFLMWSQINLRLSIRRTGGQQIDFKVFKPLR
jgi:hypothetical protein